MSFMDRNFRSMTAFECTGRIHKKAGKGSNIFLLSYHSIKYATILYLLKNDNAVHL